MFSLVSFCTLQQCHAEIDEHYSKVVKALKIPKLKVTLPTVSHTFSCFFKEFAKHMRSLSLTVTYFGRNRFSLRGT